MNLAALIAFAIGLAMLCAAVASDGAPPLEPIPLKAAAIATPVSFPRTPPIGATPIFVPVETRDLPMSNWQRQTLMAFYLAEQRGG